jgi:uncharacterized protein YjiS (DUF1127 family)
MSTGNQNVATDQLREHGAQWGSGAVSCDELTTLDDHELRDIGLTRACLRNEPNVRRETGKE